MWGSKLRTDADAATGLGPAKPTDRNARIEIFREAFRSGLPSSFFVGLVGFGCPDLESGTVCHEQCPTRKTKPLSKLRRNDDAPGVIDGGQER